jgi:hypothetical protein
MIMMIVVIMIMMRKKTNMMMNIVMMMMTMNNDDDKDMKMETPVQPGTALVEIDVNLASQRRGVSLLKTIPIPPGVVLAGS